MSLAALQSTISINSFPSDVGCISERIICGCCDSSEAVGAGQRTEQFGVVQSLVHALFFF